MALILVVDDDEQVRSLLRVMLSSAGFDVIEARDGNEGLEVAARENPDLIITDAAMPGMDGIELIERLRADPAFETLPIIMITGGYPAYGLPEKQKADALVLKPINPACFLAEINALLRTSSHKRSS